MQSSKLLSILLILVIFCAFSVFEFYRKSAKTVLNVITPTKIGIDLNGNKVFDTGEIICIPDIETFTADLGKSRADLAKRLGLSDEDALKLGYLTDTFAESLLSEKNVKLKFTGESNQDCKFADIIFNNKESYSNKLLISGLGFLDGEPQQEDNYKKKLEIARKLKLVILNHRSNKYHTLNCKYGLTANDVVIIPEKHLSPDTEPCRFCHITKSDKIKNLSSQSVYPLVISNGSIKMYLTDLTTTLKPDNKCSTLVCKEFLNQINNSSNSIDISLYGWDNVPDIYNALLKAKSRGVKIRIAYDTSINSFYPELKDIIAIADETSTDTPKIIMHNKFMIFDNSKVMTGSMNFTQTGFSGFNTNCVFFINSVEAAKIYTEEFNQMMHGKFHQSKSKVNHKTLILGSTKVTPFFSPKDKIITTNVIPLIENAKSYIYIPAFIITHDELASSLVAAKNRGVDVKLIIDAASASASGSKVKMLRAEKIPVKIENYAGKLHSKSIIIDDKYIIAGSMNLSNSGENKNDENVLIIENERLANYYKGFFEYLWTKIPDKYLTQTVRAEGKYSIGSCSDGIDNNFDGKIDKDDIGCK